MAHTPAVRKGGESWKRAGLEVTWFDILPYCAGVCGAWEVWREARGTGRATVHAWVGVAELARGQPLPCGPENGYCGCYMQRRSPPGCASVSRMGTGAVVTTPDFREPN